MSMKYLAAYALASLSIAKPTKDDIVKICKASKVSVDESELAFVLECIAERDVATLISEGAAKMSAAAAPAGGAAPAAAAGGAAAPAAGGKKEEKVEEEEDDEMGFGLFD